MILLASHSNKMHGERADEVDETKGGVDWALHIHMAKRSLPGRMCYRKCRHHELILKFQTARNERLTCSELKLTKTNSL